MKLDEGTHVLPDNVVEDLQWRKSSFSSTNGCVEVAPWGEAFVAVRDSKNPAGGIQLYDHHEWRCFLQGVRNAEFDDLVPGS
jgi:hypothetical protein